MLGDGSANEGEPQQQQVFLGQLMNGTVKRGAPAVLDWVLLGRGRHSGGLFYLYALQQ